MSRVSMKHTSGATPAAADLLNVAPRLLVLSMESARDFVSRASATLPAMPSLDTLRRSASGGGDCGCDIPETHCPPRCVCELHWEGSPGETFRATIRVRNTGKVARTFSVVSGDLSAPLAGKIAVAPGQLPLAPGGSADVALAYTVPAGAGAGDARAEVLVTGAYEQCVKVQLTVQPEATITCEVAQGEPPRRVRTMHWYRHWQCEEPCDTPRTNPDVPTTPGTIPGVPTTGTRPNQPVG